jgi:hypothetical protein
VRWWRQGGGRIDTRSKAHTPSGVDPAELVVQCAFRWRPRWFPTTNGREFYLFWGVISSVGNNLNRRSNTTLTLVVYCWLVQTRRNSLPLYSSFPFRGLILPTTRLHLSLRSAAVVNGGPRSIAPTNPSLFGHLCCSTQSEASSLSKPRDLPTHPIPHTIIDFPSNQFRRISFFFV